MKYIYTILVILFIGIALWLGIWWTKFKYNDCLEVGHSVTYCRMKIFSN